MPPTSKRQAGLLGMVAAGKRKLHGMSPEQAKEYLRGADTKNLPEKAPPPHRRHRGTKRMIAAIVKARKD